MSQPPVSPGVEAPLAAAPAFVGREAELERLMSLLDLASEKTGSVALLTGEPGTGKTALAGEFLRRAKIQNPSLVLCRSRCVELQGTAEPYFLFLDAMGSLLQSRGRMPTMEQIRMYAPTWVPLLPMMAVDPDHHEGAGKPPTGGFSRERMLREMGDLFEATAANAVMIAFLENAQWADPASVDVLRHLVNRLNRQSLLFVGTLRPNELHTADKRVKDFIADLRTNKVCHEVPLGPLRSRDVATYLDMALSPHRFPEEMSGILHRRTEGHPLYVRSQVQLLLDRRDIVNEGGCWVLSCPPDQAAVGVPDNVRDLIRGRIEALQEGDRQLLQYASVLGLEFLSSPLSTVLHGDDASIEEQLVRLDRLHRFVDPRGEEELPGGRMAARYRFRNAIYQQVIYEDVVAARRTRMHLDLAKALVGLYGVQANRIAASLAFHFERGRDFSEAVAYLAREADNALGIDDRDRALELLRQALALLAKRPPAEVAEQAISLHQKAGAIQLGASRFKEASESFTRMLDLARDSGKPSEECQALSGLCNALFFSSRLDDMAVRAAQALAAAERGGGARLRMEAMLVVAHVLQSEGNLTDCESVLEEVAALARGAGQRRVLALALTYRGVVHYWRSEYTRAEERLAAALSHATELKDVLVLLIGLQFLGLARGNRGFMSLALAAFDEGLEQSRRSGERFWLPRIASHVGWVHRELENFEAAIAHDEEGASIARECGVSSAENGSLLGLAIDYTRAGQLSKAGLILERLGSRASDADWFSWLNQIRLQSALAEYWMAKGDRSKSVDHATRLLELAGPQRAQTYVAAGHRVLFDAAEAAGDRAAALRHSEAAAAALALHPAPCYAWRRHAATAGLRDRLGDAEGARRAFAESAAVVHQIAAGVSDEGLRASFLAAPAVRSVLERV